MTNELKRHDSGDDDPKSHSRMHTFNILICYNCNYIIDISYIEMAYSSPIVRVYEDIGFYEYKIYECFLCIYFLFFLFNINTM